MKIIFFCKDSLENIRLFEYYKQDIDCLTDLGHEVLVVTKFRDIPFKFDVIFIWWWTYAFYPIFLSKLLNKPSIITGTFNFKFPEGFQGVDYFSRSFFQKVLIKYSVRNATLNLFVNKHELISCTNYFHLKSSLYYPHIISSEYTNNEKISKRMQLFNISWSGKRNLIRKGIPELIEAVSILRDQGLDIKLILAGKKGDGYDYLCDLINSFNLMSSVKLVGELSKDDKIKFMQNSEIFVQPSHYEGFGLAMAEAMACGACVITCDVGAVKDVVSDCGLYTTPGSPIDLAQKIKMAVEDHELRKKIQKMALERASAEFSSTKKLTLLNTILNGLN